MTFAIDTNRYADFANNVPSIVELVTYADAIVVPYVVLAELRAGFKAGTASQRNEECLLRFLANERVSVLYPDDGTTRMYAELFAQLRKAGTPIPTNDLWIAALVVQHGLTLATRDKHFTYIGKIHRI